jgi:hypothetical protein
MRLKTTLAAAGSLAALALATPALAACEDLAGMQIDGGRVDSAEVVAEGGFTPPAGGMGPPPGVAASPYADVPTFCRVRLTLTPSADYGLERQICRCGQRHLGGHDLVH